MEEKFTKTPKFSSPLMVAAWPGMGYLSKISIDFLRRQLRAEFFAEIIQYQNSITYKNGLVDLPLIRHRFYYSPSHNIIFCVGEGQPTSADESYALACRVVDMAKRFNVKRIYTMAAYPDEYYDSPKVYGIATHENLVELLREQKIEIGIEGMINGLNGLIIGVAKSKEIEGICLLGQIKYVNVPQLRSSKAILDALSSLMHVPIYTQALVGRAERVEERIRQRLERYEKTNKDIKDVKEPRYIS